MSWPLREVFSIYSSSICESKRPVSDVWCFRCLSNSSSEREISDCSVCFTSFVFIFSTSISVSFSERRICTSLMWKSSSLEPIWTK